MHFGYRITKRSDRIGQVARAIEAAVERILADEAQNAASIAKQLAPVRTGNLRDSIAIEQQRLTFRIVAAAPYAVHVELGTIYSDAQPFIGPAIEAIRNNLVARLTKIESEIAA